MKTSAALRRPHQPLGATLGTYHEKKMAPRRRTNIDPRWNSLRKDPSVLYEFCTEYLLTQINLWTRVRHRIVSHRYLHAGQSLFSALEPSGVKAKEESG